jgi:hypothetical protein
LIFGSGNGSLDGSSGVFDGKQFENEEREPESEGCKGGEPRFYETRPISVSLELGEDGFYEDIAGSLSAASMRTVRTKAEVINISINRPCGAGTRTLIPKSV